MADTIKMSREISKSSKPVEHITELILDKYDTFLATQLTLIAEEKGVSVADLCLMYNDITSKRNNHIIEYKGERHYIKEWAEMIGVKPNTLLYRFIRGWSVEKSLGIRNDIKSKKILDFIKNV